VASLEAQQQELQEQQQRLLEVQQQISSGDGSCGSFDSQPSSVKDRWALRLRFAAFQQDAAAWHKVHASTCRVSTPFPEMRQLERALCCTRWFVLQDPAV
jgi:hypothetical protein